MSGIQCVEGTVYDGNGETIEGIPTAFKIKAGDSNITIRNYNFRNVRYGVLGQQDGDLESRNILVENCTMHNDPGSDPFVDREGEANGTSGTDTGAGVLVYGNGVFHDTTVKLNVCTGMARIVLTGEEARAWMICGNSSDGSEDTSIYVKGHGSTIKWNSVKRAGKCGIKVRQNKNKSAPAGGHVICYNYVEGYSMIKPDGGGCYNISTSAIVQYNTGVLLEWPAGKDSDSNAVCFKYNADVVSRDNTVTVLDSRHFYGFKVDTKVVWSDCRDDTTILVGDSA